MTGKLECDAILNEVSFPAKYTEFSEEAGWERDLEAPGYIHGTVARGFHEDTWAAGTVGVAFEATDEQLEAPAVAWALEVSFAGGGAWAGCVLTLPVETFRADGEIAISDPIVKTFGFIQSDEQ
jgi:hypothetical protein